MRVLLFLGIRLIAHFDTEHVLHNVVHHRESLVLDFLIYASHILKHTFYSSGYLLSLLTLCLIVCHLLSSSKQCSKHISYHIPTHRSTLDTTPSATSHERHTLKPRSLLDHLLLVESTLGVLNLFCV